MMNVMDMDMDIYKKFTDRVTPPQIEPAIQLPFKPTIDAYKQWESELPILDTYSCSNALSLLAQALLSEQIGSNQKLELIAAAENCLYTLISNCKTNLKGANLPLRRQQAELSDALLKALTHFAQVHIQAVCSTAPSNLPQQEQQDSTSAFTITSLALYKSMELLASKQLLMSLVYQTPQGNFWNTVNALYQLSESLGLQQAEQLTFDKKKHMSIEAEFKKIHFFHLAGVNRFRRGDIASIDQILSQQVNGITSSSSISGNSTLSIDLASHSAIRYTPEPADDSDSLRFLNPKKLIEFMSSEDAIIREQHGAVSLASTKPRLIKKVIQQLIPNWSSPRSRQSPRHLQSEEVLVHPGFDSIINALVLRANPDQPKKKVSASTFSLSEIELVPISHDSLRQRNSRSSTVINAQLKSGLLANSGSGIWAKNRQKQQTGKSNKVSAEISDASLQGLQFTVTADNRPILRVTDLIAIQATNNKALQLAVIRRLNRLDGGHVSVGVEMISPDLKIASLRSTKNATEARSVIFLQGIPSINQADAIICPMIIDDKDTELMLKVNKQTSHFKIDKTLETNRVFSHYTVLKKTEVD